MAKKKKVVEEVVEVEVVEAQCSVYKNTGKVNLFTEKGRVAPGKTVDLSPEQAASYKDLEPCANN